MTSAKQKAVRKKFARCVKIKGKAERKKCFKREFKK